MEGKILGMVKRKINLNITGSMSKCFPNPQQTPPKNLSSVTRFNFFIILNLMWAGLGSNQGLTDYESVTLTN